MNLETMKDIASKRTKGPWKHDCGNCEIEDEKRNSLFCIGGACLTDINGEYLSHMQAEDNADFVEMAANNWDKIMTVVEAAKELSKSRIGLHAYTLRHPELHDKLEIALIALENKL